MQRLEVSGAVRPLYGSLGFKGLSDCIKPGFRVSRQHNLIKIWECQLLGKGKVLSLAEETKILSLEPHSPLNVLCEGLCTCVQNFGE